jgi:hypothetical protein
MSQASLKDRLASFLKRNYSHVWIANGELQRIVASKTDYTPQERRPQITRVGKRKSGRSKIRKEPLLLSLPTATRALKSSIDDSSPGLKRYPRLGRSCGSRYLMDLPALHRNPGALHCRTALTDKRVARAEPGQLEFSSRSFVLVVDHQRHAFALGQLDAFTGDGHWKSRFRYRGRAYDAGCSDKKCRN